MRLNALAVCAAAAALMLAGCVKEGVVVDKRYTPSYTTLETVTDGKRTSYQSVYHGDTWSLKLEDGDETGWVRVDETTYHEYEVGDYYGGEE